MRTPEYILSLYSNWCQAHQILPLSSQILAARNSITARVVVQTVNHLELSDICFHPSLLALCFSVELQRIEMSLPYSTFSMIPTVCGSDPPAGILTSKNISSSSLALSRDGAVCAPATWIYFFLAGNVIFKTLIKTTEKVTMLGRHAFLVLGALIRHSNCT